MSCKYKSLDNPRFCNVIHGECQFVVPPWDDQCPILAAYPDWDKYWLENQKSPVKLDGSVVVEDDGEDSVVADAADLKIEKES